MKTIIDTSNREQELECQLRKWKKVAADLAFHVRAEFGDNNFRLDRFRELAGEAADKQPIIKFQDEP